MTGYTFNQLIDFTRTSAATYVDATGKIALTPQSRNLLTYTQEFDNAAWTKTAASVTANSATAPDGTQTADKVVEDTTGPTAHGVSQTVSLGSATYTYSVYAKKSERNWLRLGTSLGANAWFNLDTGVVGSAQGITHTISDAGNGWYRCSIRVTGAITSVFTRLSDSDNSITYTGDGTSGIYLWGAQLEAVPDANLVLGSELWANQAATISNSAGGAVYTYTSATQVLDVTTAGTDNGYPRLRYDLGLVSGKLYRVEGRIDGVRSGVASARLALSGSANSLSYNSTTGVISGYAVAAGTQLEISHNGTIAGARTLATISVKEITGTTGMPTDYTRNVGGLFPPRFDYDPVTLAPKGLLIEEQRTNLLVRSEEFDNASWGKARVSVTSNAEIAPDGTATADIATATVGTSDSIAQSVTLTAAIHTFSIYVKGTASSTQALLGLFNGGFLAASGKILSGPGTITGSSTMSVSGLSTTQWTRIAFTTTSATPSGAASLLFYPGGGGTANASTVLWGAQLEAGAFATSYIPTVASQVTRSADVATITGANFSQWYNQSEGTFVVAFDTIDASSRIIEASGGSATNRVVDLYTISATEILAYGYGAINPALVTRSGMTLGARTVIAAAYKQNDYAVALNGGTAGTDTTYDGPAAANILYIGKNNGSGAELNGHIRSIKYFPTRLQNAQLQALTA